MENLLPKMAELIGEGQPFVFQEDNAPIHKARIVKAWFREHPHITVLNWPPNSPDMSYIENIWGMIVSEWVPAWERNGDAVEAHAREVWATIMRKPQIVQILAASMSRRIEALTAANGEYTKY